MSSLSPAPQNRILVTGGAGFIGSHTCVALVAAGYTPVMLDNLGNSDVRVLQRLASPQSAFDQEERMLLLAAAVLLCVLNEFVVNRLGHVEYEQARHIAYMIAL